MPMMTELLEKIQESPPQDEQALRELLDETGYDLVMKQPDGEEEVSEEADEYAEDKGPEKEAGPEEEAEEEAGEEALEGGEDKAMEFLSKIMPPGISPTPTPGENPRVKVRRMTVIAANKAMKGNKKGR
jgi:hypothetical protein